MTMTTGPAIPDIVATDAPSHGNRHHLLRRLASVVAATHFIVSMYILLGGLLVVWGFVPMWWHIPIAAWGVWVHLVNWTCPLTPLEKWLRARAGQTTYEGGFVERYILPKRFEGQMTNAKHRVVGLLVLAVNLAIYSALVFRNG
ncbi:MAG TPA: DUF2784 domain-containing protein [Gemmatimonadaceae bacterium]|nr:DUF2784 domain-containing protein [Gemmatimonadaceae bacterium]